MVALQCPLLPSSPFLSLPLPSSPFLSLNLQSYFTNATLQREKLPLSAPSPSPLSSPLSHLSLSQSSKTLSLSPIIPSNTHLPTLLTVIAIDPFAATAFRLFNQEKTSQQTNQPIKMGCREKLTLLVRSQLQNSCTPLEAAQGLPMRLVYDGWSPPQTSRASMAKASGVGLAATKEADIRARRGRLVRESFMFVVGLGWVGWAVEGDGVCWIG